MRYISNYAACNREEYCCRKKVGNFVKSSDLEKTPRYREFRSNEPIPSLGEELTHWHLKKHKLPLRNCYRSGHQTELPNDESQFRGQKVIKCEKPFLR
jgi:hypothetical protein